MGSGLLVLASGFVSVSVSRDWKMEEFDIDGLLSRSSSGPTLDPGTALDPGTREGKGSVSDSGTDSALDSGAGVDTERAG